MRDAAAFPMPSHQGTVLVTLARQRLGSGRLPGPVMRRHWQLLTAQVLRRSLELKGLRWPLTLIVDKFEARIAAVDFAREADERDKDP
jgi:hypothetical protein